MNPLSHERQGDWRRNSGHQPRSGWWKRRHDEKLERLRKERKHVRGELGGRGSRMCWCGAWHHVVLKTNWAIKVGVVHVSAGEK